MMDDGLDDPAPPGFPEKAPWYLDARAAVRNPGTALQWFGGCSLALSLLWMAVLLLSPESAFRWQYEFLVGFNKDRPAKKKVPIPPYKDFVREQTNQNLIGGVISMFA